MSNLNQAQLIGRVGKEPEIRTLQNDNQVANFSLATSDKWVDKSTGEMKEKTEWHNIVVWGKLVDVVEKYVYKGQLIFIQGQLQTRSWEKDGVTRYSTEINCKTLQMLSKKEVQQGAAPQATPAPVAEPAGPDNAGNEVDDLPF